MYYFGLIAALSLWTLLVALKVTFPYFAPFLIGLFLALFLDIPVSYLQSLGWSRSLITLILTVVTFLGLPILTGLLLLFLWQELKGLIVYAPWLTDQISDLLEGLPWITPSLGQLNLARFIESFFKWVLAIPDFVIIWFLAAFSAYFFCKDKSFFLASILKLVPEKCQSSFYALYRDTTWALWHLFRVQLIFMALTSILSMVFFSLLGLPYAILLGIAVGIVDVIPIVGPGLIYGFLALVQIYFNNLGLALAIILAYLLILLLRQFCEPQLVSSGLGLHPLIVVIVLYAGFRFWGLLGAFLAPVLLVFLQTLITTSRTI